MISVWHLFWIIPLSSTIGMFMTALMSANNRHEEND